MMQEYSSQSCQLPLRANIHIRDSSCSLADTFLVKPRCFLSLISQLAKPRTAELESPVPWEERKNNNDNDDGSKDKSKDSSLATFIQNRVYEGIRRGLDSLGKNVSDAFFSEMETSFGMTRSEVVYFPEKFAEALSGYFKAGSSIVERTVSREIVKLFDIPACPGLNFRTALEIVRKHPKTRETLDSLSSRGYDPLFCKTCQRLGVPTPVLARIPHSDCEEHFARRVVRLKKTGVRAICGGRRGGAGSRLSSAVGGIIN
jgi:hypothetical protein